mmetsp:Transcript_101976/g.295076  ORF Transcript_101976/g.295076 Transcript_101976/m.295076 type:complete len:281 (+) Transcript_101976:340-1182(+)
MARRSRPSRCVLSSCCGLAGQAKIWRWTATPASELQAKASAAYTSPRSSRMPSAATVTAMGCLTPTMHSLMTRRSLLTSMGMGSATTRTTTWTTTASRTFTTPSRATRRSMRTQMGTASVTTQTRTTTTTGCPMRWTPSRRTRRSRSTPTAMAWGTERTRTTITMASPTRRIAFRWTRASGWIRMATASVTTKTWTMTTMAFRIWLTNSRRILQCTSTRTVTALGTPAIRTTTTMGTPTKRTCSPRIRPGGPISIRTASQIARTRTTMATVCPTSRTPFH